MSPKSSCLLLLCLCSYFVSVQPKFETDECVDADEENAINQPARLPKRPKLVSVDRLPEGRHILGVTEQYLSEYPPWVNMTLLLEGQRFFRKYYAPYLYNVALSTFMVGASTDARRVVISGGRATRPAPSFHRYLITILHYSFWATVDYERNATSFFDVMNTLHAVHAKMAHESLDKRQIFDRPLIPGDAAGPNPYKIDTRAWNAFESDLRASRLRGTHAPPPAYPPKNGGTDVYFNQFAMAVQQWAFVGLPVLDPSRVFMYGVSDEELWAFMHVFALVLRSLGMRDEYNICLQPDLPTARRYYKEMLHRYLLPNLFDLDYESKVVMELGIKGVQQIFPYTDIQLILYRLCVDVLRIECPNLAGVLNPQPRLYNAIFERFGRSLLRLDGFLAVPNIFVNSVLRQLSLKSYGVDTLVPQNLTDGLVRIDEAILRTSGVHFTEEKRAVSCCPVI